MSVSINNPDQRSVCPTTRSLPIMISLHLQRMAAFLSAAQLTILVPELLHLLAFAQEHFQ
ncbi:MAG: hypothetical protein O2898_03290, partial [Proteobacteria bacterium]|nr:hypothetical protein [Pseudomonadota bacterium]